MAYFKKENKNRSFSKITIRIASPDRILEMSHGEVLKPETINYRTYKPERDGLFCEKIFGPTKDFECACGKYKRIRYKGIVCDRCGVEVIEKKVRRERMGHIKLVVPVVHIWFFKSLPNKIGYLLGLSSKALEKVIYYEKYAVIQVGSALNKIEEELNKKNTSRIDDPGDKIKKAIKQYRADCVNDPNKKFDRNSYDVTVLLDEDIYLDILNSLPKDNQTLPDSDTSKFIVKMGGEAIKELLANIDLRSASAHLISAANAEEVTQQKKIDALKRLSVFESFKEANDRIFNNPNAPLENGAKPKLVNSPEWMVTEYISVIPPDIRPLVVLDGGRFAAADLNDLYRRVIIRNNRLKRLLTIKAPEVILRNEKRMLQESVDSLFDNSKKNNSVKADAGRALKSLSDVLKGKQGRFRQNLLGKRVDYSGRSVIVVGPELKMHECGLPKDMAAELFKPFIIRKLIERGIVKTVKSAKKIVEKKEAVVWDILDNILKGHPVLLNRAPTLHRLSIQAFQPKLVEGKAIHLHPLVTSAFNADFDGDQMAVHVPLSNAAILEAQLLMLSAHNILNPQNGSPITLPSQDMVLGLYYITKERKGLKGEGKIFYSIEDVVLAYNHQQVDLHAKIKLRTRVSLENGALETKLIDTTVGRALFNQYIPESVGFENLLLTKNNLKDVIMRILRLTDMPTTVRFLDDIKQLGFNMAFRGGLSVSLNNLIIPDQRTALINGAQKEVDTVQRNYENGVITNKEKYNNIVDIWGRCDTKITESVMKTLTQDEEGFNPVFMMLDSGARGSKTQVKQLVGIRGQMTRSLGKKRTAGSINDEMTNDIIEYPILKNFREGLRVVDYFISTHGSRKGLTDTALKTADAGYLTRRLVDVAQDVIVTEEDCRTLRGIETTSLKTNDQVVESLKQRIEGRTSLYDILDPKTNELIVGAGDEITATKADRIEKAGFESIEIRSVLTCETKTGVCVKCYGRNLATSQLAQKGDAVGIIAAQSIGEPGTQLTLRTFHVGGVAGSSAVESSLKTNFDGIVSFEGVKSVKGADNSEIVISKTAEVKILSEIDRRVLVTHNIAYGSYLKAKADSRVKKGDEICSWDPFNNSIITEVEGSIEFENMTKDVSYKEVSDKETNQKSFVIIESKDRSGNLPALIVKGKGGDKKYSLPVNAHILVGTELLESKPKTSEVHVKVGTQLVKIPRQLAKSKDITGGLPKIGELFEARSSKENPAVLSEIDGIVKIGEVKRGNRRITVRSNDYGIEKEYLIPLTRPLLVQDDDYIKAGSPLSDGQILIADILRVQGAFVVQKYLVNEIQQVYRLQGVKIDDKHIEVIVRQMMRKVEIMEPGDTRFVQEDIEDKVDFVRENDEISAKVLVVDCGDSTKYIVNDKITKQQWREENFALSKANKKMMVTRPAKPATASPILLGITRASLGVQSWISAASFQETTKILSHAAIQGKTDYMLGLKENVITGHLIPAGTGQRDFDSLIVTNVRDYENLDTLRGEVIKFDERE
ncbi:MAG: DNA-directed RNA polymerase subunit beta' [Phycisphaerales bacterium]|nr:DNA-directed RNA polymerase subunit beta' [Phycisphaerales bacterium]